MKKFVVITFLSLITISFCNAQKLKGKLTQLKQIEKGELPYYKTNRHTKYSYDVYNLIVENGKQKPYNNPNQLPLPISLDGYQDGHHMIYMINDEDGVYYFSYSENYDKIFFYDHNGNIQNSTKVKLSDPIRFKITGNCEYLSFYSDLQHAYIFDKKGAILFEEDFSKQTEELGLITHLYPNQQGKGFLLNTRKGYYFFEISGTLNWSVLNTDNIANYVSDFECIEDKYVLLITNEAGSSRQLEIRSIENGKILHKKEGVDQLILNETQLIIKEGGNYYEYTID